MNQSSDAKWMVLVGPQIYDVITALCTETQKLYRFGSHRQKLKAEHIGIIVASEAEGKQLEARIDTERRKDLAVLNAYWDKQTAWHSENPRPKPRSPQDVLAALGVEMETP